MVLCYICSCWILIPIIIVQNWCAGGKLIGKSFPIGKDSFIKNFHNWHIPNISQVIEKQKVCLFLSPMIYVSQGSVFNIKLFTNDVFVLHFSRRNLTTTILKDSHVYAEFIGELNKPATPSRSPKFCSPANGRSGSRKATEFGRSAMWCWLI